MNHSLWRIVDGHIPFFIHLSYKLKNLLSENFKDQQLVCLENIFINVGHQEFTS